MTDLSSPPPLQDHRFGELIKGEHYAYARGLTINPSHDGGRVGIDGDFR